MTLFEARLRRPRPHLDDKVLTGWNGLMLAAFARAARVVPSMESRALYLAAAERNAAFFVERMWDAKAGGFHWAVQRDGRPLIADKRSYGQAFAIFGLAEYALAADDQWARDWAVDTFEVLTERAGDGALGFREEFDEHWRPVPERGR